jgi:formylglycine-generating enzyme required for sulfatase activity
MVRVEGGKARLGQSGESFGWDNERLAHDVPVDGFEISKYKVSNGEYLEYVRAGGTAPHFWLNDAGRWFYRGMFGAVPLPLDHPVWVTWEQAEGFAKWRGFGLPSEAQYCLAASRAPQPDARRHNFSFHRWDPVAVDAGDGFVGNGWEWTRDLFAPFAGFRAHQDYPGYSADFFDGAHYVMKGASPRTAERMTRPSFRNWFRPEYPYMYAGFRVVIA